MKSNDAQRHLAPNSGFSKWQYFKYTLIACLLVVVAFVRWPISNDNAALWRPRLATPAIVALDDSADRQFTAEVKASPSANHWSATIANDLKSWPCKIISASYSTINNNSEPGWRIEISVPDDTSPELFTLTISCNEFTGVQPQAVSVIEDFESDFYILHITDEQIDNQYATDPSGQYYRGVGTWEEMKWMQEPVNLINPRCVIITGDQIDFNGALDGNNNWANWGYLPRVKRIWSMQETTNLEIRLSKMYLDCHKGYHVAYVETPGNHDVTPPGKLLKGSKIDWHPISARFYEKYFGQRSYSFRMGDFYVLMHDWSDDALERWAAKDFNASLNDPTTTYRLVGQHYYAKWDGAPDGNHPFRPEMCDLMLIGHGHVTKTIQTSPYYIYMERAAFFYGAAGFFNFRRTGNGWSCDQTVSPRDEMKDVWPLFTTNGVTKNVRCDQPDPMNLTTNTVTITNDLPENFYDGRVRFVLNKGIYRTVENGKILAEYNCVNDTKTAVLVKVNIPANGNLTVQVLNHDINAEE